MYIIVWTISSILKIFMWIKFMTLWNGSNHKNILFCRKKSYSRIYKKRMKWIWIHFDGWSKKGTYQEVLVILRKNSEYKTYTILRDVKNSEGNLFILVIFIYVLDIEDYECLWWTTQIQLRYFLKHNWEKMQRGGGQRTW